MRRLEGGDPAEVAVKRVYDAYAQNDGVRVLVDRLWPRGLTKEAARIDEWLKNVAPSAGLRTWFDHASERWPHFLRRYRLEVQADPLSRDAFVRLIHIINQNNKVTLVFGAKNETQNNAVALQRFLSESELVARVQKAAPGKRGSAA